ncbi:MAG: lactonase family protein [Leptospirales bacterium]|nr:lactonase family protein [Leptospirales bacterium]
MNGIRTLLLGLLATIAALPQLQCQRADCRLTDAGCNPLTALLVWQPRPRFLYVAASNSILQFAFDASGALSLAGSLSLNATPSAMAASKGGGLVAAVAGQTLHLIALDPLRGAMSLGYSFDLGSTSFALRFSPDDRFLYVAESVSNTLDVFRVEGGAAQRIAQVATDLGPYGVLLDSSGRDLYLSQYDAASVRHFRVDASSGLLTQVLPDWTLGSDTSLLLLSPDESYLYALNSTFISVGLLARDAQTGNLTDQGAFTYTHSDVSDMKISADGAWIYFLDRGDNLLYRCARNSQNGTIGAQQDSTAVPTNPQALVLLSERGMLYTASGTASLVESRALYTGDGSIGPAIQQLAAPSATALELVVY